MSYPPRAVADRVESVPIAPVRTYHPGTDQLVIPAEEGQWAECPDGTCRFVRAYLKRRVMGRWTYLPLVLDDGVLVVPGDVT